MPSRSEILPLLMAGLAAVCFGILVGRYDGFGADLGVSVLVGIGAIVAIAIIVSGPMPCLLVVTLLVTTGFQPVIVQAASVDLTLTDLFYAGLVFWTILSAVQRAQETGPRDRPRVAFGQWVGFAFLAYAGLTLFEVSAHGGVVGDSAVSWLRLVQTAAIAWLAADLIESERDVRLVLGAIGLGAVAAVVIALASGGSVLSARSGGTLGPNALGLISGIGLLFAMFSQIPRSVGLRIALGLAMLLGLLLAKSVGSFVATGVAVAFGVTLLAPSRGPFSNPTGERFLRGGFALLLAGVLVFGSVQLLRPEATPGSEGFRGGSAAQRTILAYAGMKIFEDNPVTGVGWLVSSSPDVIGGDEVSTEVRRRFPEARSVFYPDVTPTTVHDVYVQILADLGLIGFGLLLLLVAVIAIRCRDLLVALGRDHPLWRPTATISVSLLLLLIWHNDNPLYGGQPETALPMVMLGTLAAIAKITGVPGRSWRF